MSGVVPVVPRFKFTDANGNPLANGSVTVYLAGTSTLANTYQDKALTTSNTNPVTLDSNGECLFWTDGLNEYKFLLKDSGGATVSGWPVDNIPGNGSSSFTSAGTNAQSRTMQAKVREVQYSVTDLMTDTERADVVAGTATVNVAAKINAALLMYASTPGVCEVRVPPGKYRIESTITVPEHVRLIGHSSDNFGAGLPGSEFAWYGASGSTAVITSTGDNNDWSKGSIENLRIKNYTATTTGYGLKVRNPQNGSYLRNVHVSDFPERQCYVYEPAGRLVAGTCPGFFIIDTGCFFTGGIIPLEIQCSVEQIIVKGWGVDTDATSTMGVKVTKAPLGQLQRAPIKFIGGKVEIQQVSPDIDGIVWDQDLAVSFDTVAVQRNDNITSTKSAFLYTGTTRNIPTAHFINCTSWNLANLYKFNTAAIARAADTISTPESFSWRRDAGDSALMFGRETLTAGMASAAMNTAANANFGSVGYVMARPCILAGISARHTAVITNQTITLAIIKNGATLVTSLDLNAANQGRGVDFIKGDFVPINSANFQFAQGDRVSMQISTGAAFAPTGGHVVAELFFRPL